MLVIESPFDDPKGIKTEVLTYIDYIVTGLFTLECAIKICANGFCCNGKNSYMNNSWNIADFLIVCVSLLNYPLQQYKISFLRALRMFRVLRPLRMVSRFPGLRIAVISLLKSIPHIGNVLLVSMLFIGLFSILFTTFFKGLFYHCHTDNIPENFHDLIKNKFDCLDYGGDWID